MFIIASASVLYCSRTAPLFRGFRFCPISTFSSLVLVLDLFSARFIFTIFNWFRLSVLLLFLQPFYLYYFCSPRLLPHHLPVFTSPDLILFRHFPRPALYLPSYWSQAFLPVQFVTDPCLSLWPRSVTRPLTKRSGRLEMLARYTRG